MNRVCNLVLFCSVTFLAAGCSRSNPAAPSRASNNSALGAGDPPPVILPYTGPTTSASGATGINSRGRHEQIEGRVEGFPAAPAGSFVVAGITVTTNATTSFVLRGNSAGSFADLAIGQRVHVTGQVTSGTFVASLVKIQSTQVDLPVNFNGIVSNFSGNAAAFAFFVGAREVRGDELTEFFGGSAFAGLADDVPVNVKGLQRDGYVYAERIHVEGGGDDSASDDPPDDPLDEEDDEDGEGDDDVVIPPDPPAPAAAFNPDPIQGLGQCQVYTCGFMFTALQNVTVQALGQWDQNLDGLLTNAAVGLWSSDGALIASVVIQSGTSATLDGAYRYVAIPPVQLIAGRQYVIGSAMASSGAPVFTAGGAAAAIVTVEGRFILKGSGVLGFPASPNASLFGGGNFLFVPVTP